MMVVNNGGNLSQAYFRSYLDLIITAKACSALCAQQYMFEHFFKGNPNYFGPVSYESFVQATTERE